MLMQHISPLTKQDLALFPDEMNGVQVGRSLWLLQFENLEFLNLLIEGT